MRAETGVGPAIASGSHRYRGNWADFPAAPMKSMATIAVAVVWVSASASITEEKISMQQSP